MPRQLLIATAVLLLITPALASAAETRPNFVFFLVDDLGFMDIGANNPHTFYETPHVNRLARQAARFTNGYAANPVCSPTRYSIMTGKYPSRVDATNFFSGVREGRFKPAPLNDRMPLSEVTLAETLRESGYRTAYIGKWHLGPNEKFWPEAQGFEINAGGHDRGSPPGGYFAPYNNPKLENGPDGEHLTRRLTDEATRILEQFRDDPFLLYFAFYTVHTPLQAPQHLVEKYEAKAANLDLNGARFAEEEQVWPVPAQREVRIVQDHPTYAAMVETMDTAVGQVLDKLDALGLAENTVVIFMSDNGGLSTSEGSPTSNLPLRGGKGWLYEGGIREPWLVKWPEAPSNGRTIDYPVISTDFYPTILDIAGIPPKPEQHLDGVSLVPLLNQSGTPEREAIFWHYPHYSNQGGFPGGAVRMGDYKLIERFEDGRVYLYNLKDNIGEQQDLAPQMPDRVDQMRQRLHRWYQEVDAKFLQPLGDGPLPWRPGGDDNGRG